MIYKKYKKQMLRKYKKKTDVNTKNVWFFTTHPHKWSNPLWLIIHIILIQNFIFGSLRILFLWKTNKKKININKKKITSKWERKKTCVSRVSCSPHIFVWDLYYYCYCHHQCKNIFSLIKRINNPAWKTDSTIFIFHLTFFNNKPHKFSCIYWTIIVIDCLFLFIFFLSQWSSTCIAKKSLRTKTDEFLGNFDLIILCETWLHEHIFDELFNDRYVVYRNDRVPSITTKSGGGGCLIAIKRDIPSMRMSQYEIGQVYSVQLVGVLAPFEEDCWGC